MNVHLYPFPEDTRKLCARFDLLLMLPVEDWIELFELAEKAGRLFCKIPPPAYVVNLLKAHVQHQRTQNKQIKSVCSLEE